MVLVLWVGGAVVTAALSTLALYVAFPGSIEISQARSDRAQGLFRDPNVYGPFLVPAAIFVLHELLDPRLLRGGRLLKLLALSILVLGVTTSYSRAAWLNLGVGVLVMLAVLPLRRGGGRRAGALLLTLVAVTGAAGATVVLTGSSSFLEERAHIQSYDTARFGAQRSGVKLAENHPIGIGPGQFEYLSPISAHSTYVRAFAEEGIAGLVLLGGLLLATLGIALRNVILGRGTAGISSTALLAAWCGLLANSVFVDTLHWRHLWILAGLIWAGSMLPPAAARSGVLEHRSTQPDVVRRGLVARADDEHAEQVHVEPVEHVARVHHVVDRDPVEAPDVEQAVRAAARAPACRRCPGAAARRRSRRCTRVWRWRRRPPRARHP